MKLMVRNLARTTTEVTLRAMFESLGTVQSCTLIIDKESGRSKGFGYVEMPKQGDAKAAMKTLNGREVDGSNIRVKKAKTKPESVEASDQKATSPQKDPLHGVTLETVVTRLVEKYGWDELGSRIAIKCFIKDPSISSSLKFLRKTPWARKKVETLYLDTKWQVNKIWPLSRGG